MITVVGNLKGGSGKSTVAFNLAVWLSRVAEVDAFDLDPQRTLSDVAEVRADEGYAPRFPVHHVGHDLLDQMRSRPGEVIVDVGSADMHSLCAAVSIADRVLVPVPPSQADIWSTQRFLGIVESAAPERKPEVCVFVNRADTHHAVRESDQAEEALEMLAGVRLIKHRLHQRTAYRRSFSEGLGVFELEPGGKAAGELIEFAALLYPDYA